jgi:hypothetical protein
MSAKLHEVRSNQSSAPDFIRPLGCIEHFFYLYAQVYPVHLCLRAEIEGAVDSDTLHSALNQVREWRPILKACIVGDVKVETAFYESDELVHGGGWLGGPPWRYS